MAYTYLNEIYGLVRSQGTNNWGVKTVNSVIKTWTTAEDAIAELKDSYGNADFKILQVVVKTQTDTVPTV